MCEAAPGRELVLPQMARTAQSLALGNGASILSGLNALEVNPAGLHTGQFELLLQRHQMPLQTNASFLGASVPMPFIATTLGATYLGLDSTGLDGRDALGQATGSFDSRSRVVGLHLSHRLSLKALTGILNPGGDTRDPEDVPNPLMVGASLKSLEMGIGSYRGSSFAVDLGLRYPMKSLPLTFGAAALNLGPGLRLDREASALPASQVLSASARFGVFTFLASASHRGQGAVEVALGSEWWAVPQRFALRGRFAMMKGGLASAQGLQNVGFGMGFRVWRGQSLDYAFTPLDAGMRSAGAAGTHLWTTTLRFGAPYSVDGFGPPSPAKPHWSKRFRSSTTERPKMIPGIDDKEDRRDWIERDNVQVRW